MKSRNRMSKPLGKELEALELELKQLEGTVETLKESNVDIPQNIFDKIAQLKSKINPNKFNAVKVEYNGVLYDSSREVEFKKMLEKFNIPHESQVEFLLQEKFQVDGKPIQPITLTVDFVLNGRVIVDIKGMITEEFKIKFKLLKFIHREKYLYITCTNNKEMTTACQIAILDQNNLKLDLRN